MKSWITKCFVGEIRSTHGYTVEEIPHEFFNSFGMDISADFEVKYVWRRGSEATFWHPGDPDTVEVLDVRICSIQIYDANGDVIKIENEERLYDLVLEAFYQKWPEERLTEDIMENLPEE